MNIPKYRILTIDAKEIYELQLRGKNYNITNKDGKINYERFNSFLYNSLEVERLKSEYEKAKANRKISGKFELGKYAVGDDESCATLSVVNVTFELNLKEFNSKKARNGYVYIRCGHEIDFISDLKDHICIKDGKLIAIEVPYVKSGELQVDKDKYAPVVAPCDLSALEGYFEYDAKKRCYTCTEKKIPTRFDKKQLREAIYKNGFSIESNKEIKYVRYKRSAGSSRQGNCLFIAEPLYKGMMKWSSCGLDLDKVKDQISKESYISLTLSNMEKEIVIPSTSILILPDAKSIFDDEVVSVEKDGEAIKAERKTVTVENKIWDGQGLLDESVFQENGYGHKGMMLLRNRFFKTCAFNTCLQKWFKDNGIVSLDQINSKAITRATSIEDIKLVVTDSSIKYIKLYDGTREEAISKWLDNLECGFGLVKTEKPTKHMYGNMVQTSYQLINTLELTEEEIRKLLKPAITYITDIINDPMFMRHYIKMQLKEDFFDEDRLFDDDLEYEDDFDVFDDEEDDGAEIEFMRKNVIFKLLSLSDKFATTQLYKDFRSDTRRSFIKNLKRGHLLVQGTNATLFGNGYEMLNAVTNRDYDFKKPTTQGLQSGQIRITRFEGEKELLCARSPHITMGNLLVAKNTCSCDDVYSKYFNLTNEIVCVNSIGENLLQRLNGCDFDSDAMLVTDNEILLSSAKKSYNQFLVPYCSIDNTLKNQEMWQVDSDISNNKIGEIVNLSQWLNSIYWDKRAKGEEDEVLYNEICKLAVLSGMEIDKAKRDFGVNAGGILTSIRANALKDKESNPYLKPEFLSHVKSKSTSKAEKTKYDDKIQTSMQTLVNVIKVKNASREKGKTVSEIIPEIDVKITDNDYRYKKRIIEELLEIHDKLSGIHSLMFKISKSEKTAKLHDCRELELRSVSFVQKNMKSRGVLYLLIKALDYMVEKEEEKKKARGKGKEKSKDERSVRACKTNEDAKTCRSLLLSSICNASDDFYKLVADARDEMCELEPNENGDIDIYGYIHAIIPKKSISLD